MFLHVLDRPQELVLTLVVLTGSASYENCKASDLEIKHAAVPGHAVGGRQVYGVMVVNRCACMQAAVRVECPGFSSSVQVQPQGALSQDGEFCTINGGLPIHSGIHSAVKFTYAWTSQFSLKPVSSTLDCSSAPSPF
jgi:hypothetical protein